TTRSRRARPRMSEGRQDPGGRNGPLIVIGGHEDKEGDRAILRAFSDAAHGRKVVLATIATREPEKYVESYREAFAGLPIGDLVELRLGDRAEAHDPAKLAIL